MRDVKHTMKKAWYLVEKRLLALFDMPRNESTGAFRRKDFAIQFTYIKLFFLKIQFIFHVCAGKHAYSCTNFGKMFYVERGHLPLSQLT